MPETAPIAALLNAYRPRTETEAADVARVQAVIAGAGADPWSRELPVHATASALIVHPATRRVLLRWHERIQAWLQVGGHGDPGEHDPVEVVLREAKEETNLADLACWPDAALLQVVVLPVPASPVEPAHEHADLRFVLSTETPDRAVPENPTAQLRWLTLPEAFALTTEANMHEYLTRVSDLFDRGR